MTVPQFAVETLHNYSQENSILPRDTTDLSPLEKWLVLKLYNKTTDISSSGKVIAVFTATSRDFDELELTPKRLYRRIRTIDDLRGIKFGGIIKTRNWYRGEETIVEAYDYLRNKQPELFD